MRLRDTGRAAGVLALGLGVSAAGSPPSPDEAFRSLAADAGEQRPVLRIGLDTGHALRLSGSFRILDPSRGAPLWKDRYDGEIVVVADGGPIGEVPTVYRVQVGAFGAQEAAEAERRRLEAAFGEPGIVHYVPDRRSWRVRLGRASGREALGPLVARLRAAGIEGAWITEEPAEQRDDVRLRLVDAAYESRATGVARLVVVPRSGSRVELQGKRYRGIVEIRVTRAGTLRAINWVGLEDYLLGVVPAELGPEVWPQLEALKAQAVAARTYAWRNLGQFEDEGFDLCGTPRCQVYGGASAEHPLSDRAVAATRFEILSFGGKPISAMYTATCGGYTEDASEIFPEESAPYLKGVPCRAEAEALASQRVVLDGRRVDPVASETGDDVTRDRALLAASGVVPIGEDVSAMPAGGQVLTWARALARLSGRPEPGRLEDPDVGGLGAALVRLLEAVGWSERARVLLSEEDLPALVRDPDAAGWRPEVRRAVAYLAQTGALSPFPDGRFRVDRPPTLGRIVPVLARIGDAYDAFGLKDGVVAGGDGRSLRLVRGKGEVRLPLARDPFLFSLAGERTAPVARLELWPGDRVRFRSNERGQIDFLEMRPPVKGVSDDRSAKVYSWDLRQTRAEVEEAVRRRVDVGRLEDLEVVRRGVSGRIVELRVLGDRGSTLVKGFDVRTLLGLRESLTVIEVQRDDAGRIEAVVFAGKGWGHGVGLCQVGAYGMAIRGAGYRDILAHYYRGATLEKIPSASR